MHRIISIASTASMLILAAACGGDSQGPTSEDLRVQDSVLSHDVMAAWGDSFHVTVEEPHYADSAIPGKTQVAVKSPAVRGAVAQPSRAIPPLADTQAPAIIPTAPSVVMLAGASKTAAPKRVEQPREETRAHIRSIPKGAVLSLVTGDRFCSSRVGETFRATLLSPIATSGGTIPSGARATAEITSNDQWGAGIGVRIRAIHNHGETYPVSSRVTYIVLENSGDGTCIPRRSHIDTEVRG